MSDADSIALTDDEAAAIAVLADGAWRSPLPTVNEADTADLASAVLRGRRSLVVRELAAPDGAVTGAAAAVLARLGAGPCAAFLLVDADGDWIPAGPTIYLYGPSPDEVQMSHVVAASGVHYLRVAPPPGQWAALTGLAEAVYEDGFAEGRDGARQPAAALLSGGREAGLRTIRVARGAASVVRDQPGETFASVADAISWMLA